MIHSQSTECPKKNMSCFSGTPCKGNKPSASIASSGTFPGSSPSPTIWTPLLGDKPNSNNIVTEVDNATSKYFCGSSWNALVDNCAEAKPCPSGSNAECEGGQSCFADTPCGKVTSSTPSSKVGELNFAAMVDTIPPYCKDKKTMSRNVGYWQSWSIYREDDCNPFTSESIDASSYTHIVFSFASISAEGTLEPWDFEADIEGGEYQKFLNVRERYPGIKLLIAVGGWTHNDPENERLYRFSNAASTEMNRMKFAQSAVNFMREYGYDGLDIDWEYPGDETRGGNATIDKRNLVLLCEELRKFFDAASEGFQLTIAIPASIARFESGFDLGGIAKSVDFFNVMAYDMHGVWDFPPVTGAHSDIAGINEAIDFMLTDVAASQIVMGMPAYGRSYTMVDESCLALGCPFDESSNETAIGGCLDTSGFVPYVEIYDWTQMGEGRGYDSITVDLTTYSAVMVKDGNQFISYDNLETFKAKVDYASKRCLGGTMVWAIDMIPLGTQSAGGSGNAGSGQSVLTEEQAVLAFCGTSWDDAVSTCSRPCPSGLSDDCNKGETCFAGTPCGSGGAVPVGETCQICPDSTSYGIRSWVDVEVKVDGTSTSTTCGELDYGVLRSVSKDSDACDKVQLELSQKCCYTYPQDQCLLCRKGGEYLNIRSDVNVTWPDGTEASCSLVNSMLSPEEDTSEMCVTTKDNLFDSCCYHACNLCEGKGLKWWVEFEENNDGGDRRQQEGTEVAPNEEEGGSGEDPKGTKSCSSIDASLYADFVEVNSDQCLETKSTYQLDCCYEFPTNACSLCGGQTLLWATEVEYEGKIVTCGVTDNIVNTEDESSPTCTSARGKLSSSCCFDKCKLCDNEQLAWDYVIDYYNDTSKTCGDIEAIFAANEVMSDSEVCSSTKEDFQDLCCFTPPITPCELCPEYIRWDEVVELQGVKSTCKEATAILKRDEEFGDQCKIAKEHMQETCCYELCDVCGDSLMLDWDAVVEYEGESVACGDLKQILGRDEIEEGSDACDVAKSTHRDFCCYTPPDKPCNMCQKETTYFDTYSTVEVDFLGTLMNCSAVYDYLIRRIESESESCSSAKNSVFDQCCYNKCAICGGGQSQDFEEQIELDGELISCMQLHTVRTNDVAAESDTCQSMQSKFSSTCCYDAPSTPCVLCAEGAVRKEVVVDFGGDTESCDQIANFLANRASNGTDECSTAKAELMQHCCFDKCRLCKESEEINWDGYVTFEGKDDVSCGSFDWYFMTNVIEDGSDHCLQIISAFSKQCCYEPIDYSTPACTLCKKGDVWYEINGAVKVYFEGSSRTCTDVSNSLFRKYDEQNGFCDAARNEYFDACCFEKCDICQGSLLDANVEVAYNGTATTCLELGVMFAANIVQEGSEECEAAKSALFEPCCYQSPSDPCVLCQSMTKGKAGEVRKNVDVNFYGSTTTCFDLNSFLVAREEQLGFMCQAAKAELQETCCFQKCDICDGGNLYWDNPVQFNGATFACGELTWIITGNVYEEGSGDCNQIQATYYDTCCNGPSPDIPNAANKCEICPDGKDLYAPVVYGEKTITCLELDSVLLRNAVFGNSAECKQVTQEYSPTCCYTPPISPCNLCHVGRNAYSVAEGTVEFNGAQSDCYGIHNYLSTRVEAEDDVCIVAQHDLFEKCCYDKCSLCQSYRLNNEAVVIMDDVKMSCSEIENNFIGLNQITQGSEQCSLLQQQHFNNCCYDVPCDVCEEDDMSYELLVQSPATYKGSNITCGEVAMLAKQEMSQSDVCKTTKNNLFASCCYKQCNLCKNTGWAIEWNKKLTFDNLASTCLDVFMNLRSEMIQQGDDKCQSIQYTVSYECCYKLPTNQCSLCQASNGTFLNTNWDSEVKYQEKKMTCGDVHAILSSEEIDGALCLEARETLWSQCCTPQKGKINLPTLPSGVSDNTGSWPDYGDTGFGNFVMSNGALSPSLCIFAALILIVMAALFTVDDIANKS
jgi:chitinase